MPERADTQTIVNYLLSGGVIAYQRSLARAVGDHSAGLLLSQFWYWSEKQPDEREGWFFMTQEQITDETVMTRREQETARRKLRDLGILEEKKKGVPAKLWFRINKEAVVSVLQQKAVPQYGAFRHTSMSQTANQGRANPTLKQGVISHTISKSSPKESAKNTAATAARPEPTLTKPDESAAVLVDELTTFQLNRGDAVKFTQDKPNVCRQQIEFLRYILRHNPDFKFKTSKGAYLRSAIEQEYGPPPGYQEGLKKQREAEARLSANAAHRARDAHKSQLLPEYMQYVRRMQERLAHQHANAYQEFENTEAEQIRRFEELKLKTPLKIFLTEEQRLDRLQKHFGDYHPCRVLDFWQWDSMKSSEHTGIPHGNDSEVANTTSSVIA